MSLTCLLLKLFALDMQNLSQNKDFSTNLHSTETCLKHSTNLKGAGNIRTSNVVKIKFELRHICAQHVSK